MARNSSKKIDEAGIEVPQGFDIRAERAQADGFVKKDAGVTVQGRLLSRFTMEGDSAPRIIYQVLLDKPCPAVTGSGEEAAVETLEPGKVVNIDGAALMELDKYANNGGVYDVWIHFKGKRKVGRGLMWDAMVRLRQVKAPPPGSHHERAPF